MQYYLALSKAFQENQINELGLLPFTIDLKDLPKKNEVYYPFAVIDTKLGIPKSTLATTLKEAFEIYTTLSKDDYKGIEQVTRIMITLKPDNYTAMNKRKELVLSGYIQLTDELKLLDLIFTIPKHSKSSVAWYHRQWIVSQWNSIDAQAEIDASEKACVLYPRNYYAWSYRSWIFSRHLELREDEYNRVTKWIELNISDSSGLHYLESVLKEYKENIKDRHSGWLNDLIVKFPGYESLWCHKRFCTSFFTNTLFSSEHQFIQDIICGRHKEQALNTDYLNAQENLALKFGLWIVILEKRQCQGISTSPLWINRYNTVAPTSYFIDSL
ncbi:hypothetical protein BY458DRAFT_511448 [Sporodiniella umbellata]|nr:hypothetical protein BY458DRAFT_511448 [Sporodiniella umbellata]